MDFIGFKSSGNSGDIVSSMASMKMAFEKTGKKVVVYIRLNTPAYYYSGAPKHPVIDDEGQEVMMNERMYEMLKPLLLSQDYIEDVKVWKGDKIDVDLDEIRRKYCGMPYFAIQHWYGMIYHDLFCDISKQWINVLNEKNGKIIINRTERYTNPHITYFFLKDYKEVLFVGTENEHEKFCNDWDLDIERRIVNNFYELAQVINGSKFFIGNQSMCWNIAEAMKVPRVLELCEYAPNCIPVGKDAFGFLHQTALEYYTKYLWNK